jgi:hypothetical protein
MFNLGLPFIEDSCEIIQANPNNRLTLRRRGVWCMVAMDAYRFLFTALALTGVAEFAHVYTKHHKDWYGRRIWTSFLAQLLLPELLIIIIYIDVLDFGQHAPFLKNYLILLMAVSAILAHFLPHRILGKKWDIFLDKPFTISRLELATSLVAHPSCRTILNMSITDANLSEREEKELQEIALDEPLTEPEVLKIIRCLGTSRVSAAHSVYVRTHK